MQPTTAFVPTVALRLSPCARAANLDPRSRAGLSSAASCTFRAHRRTAFLPTSVTAPTSAPVVAPAPRRTAPRMVSAEAARVGIAVYGVLMAGGGVGAFLKSGSKPSIVSGVASGILLAAAYLQESVPAALAIAAALSVVFAIRLAKTNKFIPAGLLCVLSVAAVIFFAAAIYA